MNYEFETEWIREFSHSGHNLAKLPGPERKERIRVAILREAKRHSPFRDSGLTYEAAYRDCYGTPLDLRRFPRDIIPAHRLETDDPPTDDEGDDDEHDDD